MCNTEEETAVSDTIMKVLYMGYAKKGFQDFNFKKALTNRGQAKKARKLKKLKQEQRLSKFINADGKVDKGALKAVAAGHEDMIAKAAAGVDKEAVKAAALHAQAEGKIDLS